MPTRVLPENPSAPAVGRKLLARIYWASIFLLVAVFLFTLAGVATKSDSNWPEALLLVLATVSTLAALARQLPLQNVFTAAFIIALIGGGIQALGVKTSIPFGPFIFGENAGAKIFNTLPWIMPLLWVVVILNSRGVARLILRPWRKTRTYGIWLIGLTAALTMWFDVAFDPFAWFIKHYWIWAQTKFLVTWQGAPLTNSISWLLVTLLILAFATPALINKQLSKRRPPNFHPLIVWLGAILLFAVGAATHGLWAAVAVDGIIAVLAAGFAIRGARW